MRRRNTLRLSDCSMVDIAMVVQEFSETTGPGVAGVT
jgi:hypothetical protein